MHIKNHKLLNAEQIMSPNHDARPDTLDISLLVIHCISLPEGQFNTPFIQQLFTNQLAASDHPSFNDIYQLKVSSHIVIKRNGLIEQYVPFDLRAWHAGVSTYLGREKCNDFSIGIELEGSIQHSYTQNQYQQLAQVIVALLHYYPSLSQTHIVGHSDIAPERKADPGTYFDWQALHALIDRYKNDNMAFTC